MIVHVPAGVRRATSGGGGRAQQRERMFEFVDVFNNPNARFPKGLCDVAVAGLKLDFKVFLKHLD